jgi:hypothetical protein
MHVITYAHVHDGVLYTGTLSDLDGRPKATWSYKAGGRRVTQDQPLDPAAFRSLWNRIGNLDVFKRNRARDPNAPVDPVGTYVVSIGFGEPDRPQLVTFAVPADEPDPQFRSWLKSLNVPTGAAAPPPLPPARKPVKPAEEAEPAEEVDELIAAREEMYASLFGPVWTVDRGEDGDGPAIDVYTFEPEDSHKRDFFTLITGGMADERMRVPKGAEYRRAELVLYVAEPTELHVNLLRWLATLPHVQETTWYGPGTTMNNGNPPQPIFDDSVLDNFLFLESIVSPDNTLSEQWTLDDDPVGLLWVVPITDAERHFIMDRELSDFLDLLDRKGHPHVLDEGRRSYVRAK